MEEADEITTAFCIPKSEIKLVLSQTIGEIRPEVFHLIRAADAAHLLLGGEGFAVPSTSFEQPTGREESRFSAEKWL